MVNDRNEGFLGAAIATARDRRQAFLAMAVLVVAFAVTAPLAHWRVLAIPQFVPIYDTAIFVLETLAAVLLYAQFEHLHRRSLLVLACAYVFTPLVVGAHALSVPNALVPGTMIGGEQTAAWLWVAWHAVFPVFIGAYALMARTEPAHAAVPDAARRRTGMIALAGTLALALAAIAVVTVGDRVMPPLMRGDTQHSRVTTLVLAVTWLVHVAALGALGWKTRLRRVIDAWLAVTLVALAIDVLLSAVLVTSRYQLGYYLGRAYGLLAALFVLGVLLRETVMLSAMAARAAAALRESAEKYRSLFETMEEGFALCEVVRDDARRAVDYRVLEANAAFEQQHGVPGAEAMAGARLEACARVVASRAPMRLEQHNQSDEGLGRWLSVGLFPRGGDQFAQLVYDITDRKRAHDALAQRTEALADLDRAKTTFFSNVSHDFRTPLTLMLGPAEELLAGAYGALAAPQREPIEVLHRNALRLQKLVNALLDFSRIEAGRIQASYEPVDLAALTRDLASSFRAAVEHAGLTLRVDCPELPEPVHVDRDMWERIVLNLLSNAFKFTFEGSIDVRLGAEAERVRLEVADTGEGIAEHELPRLFERFHRIEGQRARSDEGSGIGLALVHELVSVQGGEVRVTSTPGAGSTFTVLVPRGARRVPVDETRPPEALARRASSSPAYIEEALAWSSNGRAAAAPPSPEQGRVAARGALRVLLADDNRDMREYLARLLGEEWDVEAVADGLAALEAARRDPPALVLADVMMPGLDGFELVCELRADARTRHIAIVMLSARAGEEARVDGLDAGADDYLIKPFSARELRARVRANLELSRARLSAGEAARAANRAKDDFLAMLGHELRNPLSPILTSLQILRLRGAEFRELDVMERQVGHLMRLVDDLLDVSRITRGKIELRRRPMELAESVARAIELSSPMLEQRRQRLEVHVAQNGLGLDADPERLAQVISNLLINAAKYSDPGSLILVRAMRQADCIQLRVKDEGVGITPDMLGKIFDLFVQQSQTLDRSKGGLGLGLTIARSIVELHGGAITVHSDGDGAGSEFTVELPAVDLLQATTAPAAAERPQRAADARGKRILIVDDNRDAALSLQHALNELGYLVEVAHDGLTALQVAQSFQPDAALLDIGLPVMDGYELAQRLREIPGPSRELRLIAITGYGQESDRQRAAAAGFHKHLVKPIDLLQLVRVVEEPRS